MNSDEGSAERVGVALGAPGAVLEGRYRLSRRIGRGGMADVWAADDVVLQRPAAVKLFRFDAPGVDEHRIDAEMRMIAQLNHPGIVTVYDAGAAHDPASHDGLRTPYLVMELVDGPTLADRLASGPLSPAEALTLAQQLSDTLTYLHGCGVIHRDIKPANILLQPVTAVDGDDARSHTVFRARLTDFGVARLVDSTRLTMGGMTFGTANYLSPEQATGAPVGPPSDVYSFSLVLLECFTGRVAYPGVGMEAAVARLHRAPEVPDDLGEGWGDLLRAMSAPDPGDRPTAATINAGLKRWPAGASPNGDVVTLAGADSETQQIRSLAAPQVTRLLTQTTAAATVDRRRSWWAKPAVWAGLLVAAIAISLLAVLANSDNGQRLGPTPSPSPRPNYPAVSGSVGEHLQQLEDAVG